MRYAKGRKKKKKGEGGFILSGGGFYLAELYRQSQNGQILLNCIMFMYMTQLPASIPRYVTLYTNRDVLSDFSCIAKPRLNILPV